MIELPQSRPRLDCRTGTAAAIFQKSITTAAAERLLATKSTHLTSRISSTTQQRERATRARIRRGAHSNGEESMTTQVSPRGPSSSVDPFSRAYLSDPYPFHHELREAGSAVWLEKHSIWVVARYDEVFRVLNDWRTFCSSRGVGMTDFGKHRPPSYRAPSPVLERDPPDHTVTRAVLSKVLSPTLMKTLRDGFAAAADRKVDELIDLGGFDAITELAQGFPLSVFS